MFIKGEKVFLRPIQQDDFYQILAWENDVDNWRYSDIEAPYSQTEILEYIKTASLVRQNQQVRFMICLNDTQEPIGSVDIFSINFRFSHAAIGILIATKEHRKKGFALEALLLVEEYVKNQLELGQIYCEVQADNEASIRLFEKAGYIRTGIKKNWYKFKSEQIDAYFYQKIF